MHYMINLDQNLAWSMYLSAIDCIIIHKKEKKIIEEFCFVSK